jgi:hypothetical protein
LIEKPIYEALIGQARKRGTTAPKLARLSLVVSLSDQIVDSILDASPPTPNQRVTRTKSPQPVEGAIARLARAPFLTHCGSRMDEDAAMRSILC